MKEFFSEEVPSKHTFLFSIVNIYFTPVVASISCGFHLIVVPNTLSFPFTRLSSNFITVGSNH